MILKRGDRVRITGVMPNDPAPLEVGEEGTVITVMNQATTLEQIHVDWDSGRTLLLLPADPFEVVLPKRTRNRGTESSPEKP